MTIKFALASVAMLLGILPVSQATETVDAAFLDVVEWRMVGPYRGGRVTTVTGVPDNPQLYYMGATRRRRLEDRKRRNQLGKRLGRVL